MASLARTFTSSLANRSYRAVPASASAFKSIFVGFNNNDDQKQPNGN
jgi:hypothetical protein